jgi:aspartyl aminopeptidase
VALDSLIGYSELNSVSSNGNDEIQMIALFDHEEIGSGTGVGAASPLLEDTMMRIVNDIHSRSDETTQPYPNLTELIRKTKSRYE